MLLSNSKFTLFSLLLLSIAYTYRANVAYASMTKTINLVMYYQGEKTENAVIEQYYYDTVNNIDKIKTQYFDTWP